MDKPSPEVMPLRPGIPLDPILQLWGGNLQPLPPVTLTGGTADPLCLPNPNRVALYLWSINGTGEWTIAPGPGPVVIPTDITRASTPVVVHCRDFPGMTQGDWVISGMAGNEVGVAEYVLQPWWGN